MRESVSCAGAALARFRAEGGRACGLGGESAPPSPSVLSSRAEGGLAPRVDIDRHIRADSLIARHVIRATCLESSAAARVPSRRRVRRRSGGFCARALADTVDPFLRFRHSPIRRIALQPFARADANQTMIASRRQVFQFDDRIEPRHIERDNEWLRQSAVAPKIAGHEHGPDSIISTIVMPTASNIKNAFHIMQSHDHLECSSLPQSILV
ncbi:hypothetical protein [Burkholderia mayonis]|uniref:hypothetical protein n=1 Tax=Burkholderia mayonis TaxID=1385591 RepID=UPI00131F2EF8|nr:hypothetical protein [Burkholderia mayonis]